MIICSILYIDSILYCLLYKLYYMLRCFPKSLAPQRAPPSSLRRLTGPWVSLPTALSPTSSPGRASCGWRTGRMRCTQQPSGKWSSDARGDRIGRVPSNVHYIIILLKLGIAGGNNGCCNLVLQIKKFTFCILLFYFYYYYYYYFYYYYYCIYE